MKYSVNSTRAADSGETSANRSRRHGVVNGRQRPSSASTVISRPACFRLLTTCLLVSSLLLGGACSNDAPDAGSEAGVAAPEEVLSDGNLDAAEAPDQLDDNVAPDSVPSVPPELAKSEDSLVGDLRARGLEGEQFDTCLRLRTVANEVSRAVMVGDFTRDLAQRLRGAGNGTGGDVTEALGVLAEAYESWQREGESADVSGDRLVWASETLTEYDVEHCRAGSGR